MIDEIRRRAEADERALNAVDTLIGAEARAVQAGRDANHLVARLVRRGRDVARRGRTVAGRMVPSRSGPPRITRVDVVTVAPHDSEHLDPEHDDPKHNDPGRHDTEHYDPEHDDPEPYDAQRSWLKIYRSGEARLAPHAVARLVEEFDRHPDLDLAYCDGAGATTSDGRTVAPLILPGFSPERLADQFYLGHVVAVRGSSDRFPADSLHPEPWSLIARTAADADRVAHIPERLYRVAPSSRSAPPCPSVPAGGPGRPRPEVPPAVGSDIAVSVVIPTRGGRRQLRRGEVVLVEQALRSIVERSTWPRFEVVVVTTPGTPAGLGEHLHDIVRASDRVALTVVEDDRPFNFSNASNLGAVVAQGDLLVFLNDDTEVISADWLEQLAGHARQPRIGAVGAKLLFEDGAVQHAGIWCRGGHPVHRYEGAEDDGGYLEALNVAQNCLAVTGACLAVERSKFTAVGGFSPEFPNSYNDVDLCLKLLDRGRRTVIEPRARLVHHEASTRDPTIPDADLVALHQRWRHRLNNDPFDNPGHDAKLSEELPLPESAAAPSPVTERREARHWPLTPVGRTD